MLVSAVSVLVVAQSSSEIPEGLTNNPVYCYMLFKREDFRAAHRINLSKPSGYFMYHQVYHSKILHRAHIALIYFV